MMKPPACHPERSEESIRVKSQNPNVETPNNGQITIERSANNWDLEIGISLEFGRLAFGI
jgi:hypothetical protein